MGARLEAAIKSTRSFLESVETTGRDWTQVEEGLREMLLFAEALRDGGSAVRGLIALVESLEDDLKLERNRHSRGRIVGDAEIRAANWKADALRYCKNAEHWRGKYERLMARIDRAAQEEGCAAEIPGVEGIRRAGPVTATVHWDRDVDPARGAFFVLGRIRDVVRRPDLSPTSALEEIKRELR